MLFSRRKLIVLPLAAGALSFAGLSTRAAAATGSGSTTPAPETTVFTSGADGYAVYRIPAVVRTARGSLVAFAEARDSSSDSARTVVVARRSSDGGRTWGDQAVVAGDGSNTHGNPSPVVDPRTGRLILLTCTNGAGVTEAEIMAGQAAAQDGRRVWVQASTDDGLTFSPPREITDATKHPDWRWYATGPGHAIALDRGPYRGRLVAPANHSTPPPAGSTDVGTEAKYYGGHCLLSDDGGTTWRIGFVDDAPDGAINANETAVAQLPDGTVYFNARNQNGTAPGVRVDARSQDGGAHLDQPYAPQVQLAGPVVEGSLLQPDGGPLLFAGPADPSARADMAVRASTDGGRTWTAVDTLTQLPAGYSDLVQTGPDEVGLLYETGTATAYDRIAFARLPLHALRP
ncbi:sialidase-1 [Actinacidiphila yanglinensis]|uniref:exo-alpha-sialidase n=1 Tax=Actinacidiphila yanglinensis TaxID=310779 RepID=A0A1H6DX70_9ACTN|nr:sialidase family protein [Actinacidiphila yanglinensis]SEG89303.1 sialidase-1 [Actinacidiphila yanglinensis]